MKLKQVHIQSVLNYEDFMLDFKRGGYGLYLIYGPNETGKSTLLQVLIDLLFGGKADQKLYGSASRIRAIIEHQGKEYNISRRRRYSKIEVDRNENSLSEEEIARLLGGYTKEQYRLLFGFDHERLRAGGESLLKSEGEAGISLFETGGGLQNLQNVLSALEERSKELLEPAFRANSKRKINIAVRLHNSAIEELRKAGLKGDDYQKLRNHVFAKQELVQTLTAKKEKYDREKAKFARIKRIRDKVIQLENRRAALKQFGDFTPLPDEHDRDIPEIIDRIGEEKGKLKQFLAEKEMRENEMNSIDIERDILTIGEEIDQLSENLGQYLTRKNEEIPQEKEQISQLKIAAQEIFERLAPGLSFEHLDQLRIPFIDEEALIKLARTIIELKREYGSALHHAASIKREREQKEEELRNIGEPKDISMLKHLINELRKIGDLEKTIVSKKLEIARKEAAINERLMRQDIWKSSGPELLETALPLEETIERYNEIWENYRRKLDELRTAIAKTEQDLRQNERDLETIKLAGEIPVEEELVAAREQRNTGWRLIKMAWLEGTYDEAAISAFSGEQPLHAAYEKAVERADAIADIMRKESKLSATRSQLLAKQKQLQEDLRSLNEKLAAEEKAFRRIQDEWQNEWNASGIEAKSPAEMKAWYTHVYQRLIADMHELQNDKDEFLALQEEKERFCFRIIQELTSLGVSVKKKDDLNYLLEIAGKVVESNEEKRNLANYTRTAIREIESRLREQESKLKEYAALIQEKEQELDLYRMKYPHLPGDEELLADYIDQLRSLFQHVDAIKQKQIELENKEKAVRDFEERTQKLAKHLQEELDAYVSYEQYVRDLKSRFREASERLSNRNRIRDEIEQLDEEIAKRKFELEGLQERMDHYKSAYSCASEEELHQLVQKSQRYKELQQDIETIERDLIVTGDYLPIEQLVDEVKTAPDETVLNQKLADLERKIQEIQGELTKEYQLLGELQEKLRQLDGSDTRAADLAQKAETHLAEVDRYWNEFLRVEIARKMLQRAIERFREENEGTIIEKAGNYFQKLTLGTYQGLTIEYDGVDPYIEVLHDSGQRWRVSALSDGARDQLYLSLRLAFIEQQLNTGQALPIIMDDILVNFDDERALATLHVLDELAEKTQILYFTHHQAIARLHTKLNNAEVIALGSMKQKAYTN